MNGENPKPTNFIASLSKKKKKEKTSKVCIIIIKLKIQKVPAYTNESQ